MSSNSQQSNSSNSDPLVSVVTPFYNDGHYLKECIASVLDQEYSNFEYILVNNKSTDDSVQIARDAEKLDPRVTVYDMEEFVGQVENFNRALRKISNQSKYTKIVMGDDWIYRSCLRELVSAMEQSPSIAAATSYEVLGWTDRAAVYLDGLPVSTTMMPGREICRRLLIEGFYVFGTPSVGMFRSDIIRQRGDFYALGSPVQDAEVFFEILRDKDFGFVHQVLTMTRRDNVSTVSKFSNFSLVNLTRMLALKRFGNLYLSADEINTISAKVRSVYYSSLGQAALKGLPEGAWTAHENALSNAGLSISRLRVFVGALLALVDKVLNPKRSMERLLSKIR